MTYQEFQVWYHTFHMAFGPCRKETTNQLAIKEAEEVADFVVNKYKDVKMPEVPNEIPKLDSLLSNLMNNEILKGK